MTEFFYDLLKASFHGSIVILAVILLRQLLKKAPRSVFCLLWLLAGLRLVLPFEIESNLSLQPQVDAPELSIQAQQPVPVPDFLVPEADANLPETAPDPVDPEDYENWQSESYLYKEEEGTLTPLTIGDIAAGVWILGMAGMLTASAVSYIRLKRRVRMAYLIENGCFECPGLDTAFVLGFLPPKIYLPAGLTDDEKKFIFDHENTHIARHDHWYKLLGYLVLSLHWFNPLVWIGYSLLCRDIELACDEHVVKFMSLAQRKAYSAALLACGGHTARIAACPVAFGESNPKKRILNVLNYKRPTFWISLLAIIAVIFVAVCLLTSPDQGDDPTETIKVPAPENAAELEEQVREMLVEYANRNVVSFESISEFKVDEFLDTWVFRQGSDWIHVESDSGGVRWETVLDGVGLLAMQGSQEPARCSHWLLSTDWANADFDILWCSENGDIIDCTVLLPFTVGEETAPDYWLELNLDHNGQLEKLTQRVCVDAEHNGKPVSRQLREEDIFIRSEADCIEYLGVEHRENSDCHVYGIHAPDSIGGFHLCVELSQSFTTITRTEDISQYTFCDGNGCVHDAHAHHGHTGLTVAEYVEKCREAVMALKNGEELYLCTENLGNPMETTNVYAHAANGWLFQYRRPGWDYEAVNWLCLGNSQYIYGGNMDENGIMTTPYYWQAEQNPESHDYQLPYPFDLDWENIELVYDGAVEANGMEAVTIRFPLYLDEFIFYFSDQGELWYFDVGDSTGEPEATSLRFYVEFPYDGTVADYLAGLYVEAAAKAGQKPGIPDDAFYEELFTRKADGAYTDRWIYDLFHAFYICPEEFVSHLAGHGRAEEIITHMGYSVEIYAPYRFASVVSQLKENPNTDPTLMTLLEACLNGGTQTEQQWQDKCRTALETYQAQGSWVILVENTFTGDGAMNSYSTALWHIDGQDWHKQAITGSADFTSEHCYLKTAGKTYCRENHTIHDPANGEGFSTGWTEDSQYADMPLPWPLAFNWDEANLEYVQTETWDRGEKITFTVRGSLYAGEQRGIDSYQVTLWLTERGELWSIDMTYTQKDGMGETTSVRSIITPNAAAPEEAANMIELKYQEATQ